MIGSVNTVCASVSSSVRSNIPSLKFHTTASPMMGEYHHHHHPWCSQQQESLQSTVSYKQVLLWGRRGQSPEQVCIMFISAGILESHSKFSEELKQHMYWWWWWWWSGTLGDDVIACFQVWQWSSLSRRRANCRRWRTTRATRSNWRSTLSSNRCQFPTRSRCSTCSTRSRCSTFRHLVFWKFLTWSFSKQVFNWLIQICQTFFKKKSCPPLKKSIGLKKWYLWKLHKTESNFQ